MIQEQISTSSPRCLDGNAGFGIVAQTSGMASNVARDVAALSGYSHLGPAGDPKNPVAFLHAIRRSGGMDRHIISRVADCGNDYSGRTNRIGHHLIVEQSDVPMLSAGPAAIASQHGLFHTAWNEKSRELPTGKSLPNPSVAAGVCRIWQQFQGDAGWGGIVAERIERGDPISIIFEPGTDVLPLLAEAFALLPTPVRWKATFSTFFMKSQEPPTAAKIQIKCIAAGSDEMAFARLTPNTLVIDLRQRPGEPPSGKYVEAARTGILPRAAAPKAPDRSVREPVPVVGVPLEQESGGTYDFAFHQTGVPILGVPMRKKGGRKKRAKKTGWLLWAVVGLLLLAAVGGAAGFLVYKAMSEEKAKAVALKSAKDAIEQAKKKLDEAKEEAEKVNGIAKRANTEAERAIRQAGEVEDNLTKADTAIETATTKATEAKQEADKAEPNIETMERLVQEVGTAVKGAVARRDNISLVDTPVTKAKTIAGEAVEIAANAERILGEAKALIAEAKEWATKINLDADLEEVDQKTVETEQIVTLAKTDADTAKKKAGDAVTRVKNADTHVKATEKRLVDAQNAQKDTIAAVERAKEERKEAEEKAATEKEIEAKLAALPEVWRDLALPNNNVGKPVVLGDTEFLDEIKDRVTIKIVPFVELSETPGLRIVQTTEKDRCIVFSIKNVESKAEEPIIEFSLKEGGIACEWNAETYRTYNAQDYRPKLNRIFLSKLWIEVEGFEPKEIALWTPVEFTDRQFDATFKEKRNGRPSFTLWEPDGKEFVVDPKKEEDLWLYLNFDQCIRKAESIDETFSVDKSQKPKKHPQSFAYVPVIQGIPSTVEYGLVPDKSVTGREDMRFLIDFQSDTAESPEQKTIQSKIDEEKKKTITPGDRTKNRKEIGASKKDIGRWSTGQFTPDEQQRFANPATVQQAIASATKRIEALQNALDASADALKEIRRLEQQLSKLGDPWRSARIDIFSIDLIKKNTPAGKVTLPENRLPLFQVVRDEDYIRPVEEQGESDKPDDDDKPDDEDSDEFEGEVAV